MVFKGYAKIMRKQLLPAKCKELLCKVTIKNKNI